MFDHESLRRMREAKGWSQEQAVAASGVPMGTYRDLEQGKTADPAFSTAQALAAAFGVDCGRFGLPTAPPADPPAKKPRGRPKKTPDAVAPGPDPDDAEAPDPPPPAHAATPEPLPPPPQPVSAPAAETGHAGHLKKPAPPPVPVAPPRLPPPVPPPAPPRKPRAWGT